MIRGVGLGLMFTVVFVLWVWFSMFLGKQVTYKFFYEPSIRETIHKVLHEEHLR